MIVAEPMQIDNDNNELRVEQVIRETLDHQVENNEESDEIRGGNETGAVECPSPERQESSTANRCEEDLDTHQADTQSNHSESSDAISSESSVDGSSTGSSSTSNAESSSDNSAISSTDDTNDEDGDHDDIGDQTVRDLPRLSEHILQAAQQAINTINAEHDEHSNPSSLSSVSSSSESNRGETEPSDNADEEVSEESAVLIETIADVVEGQPIGDQEIVPRDTLVSEATSQEMVDRELVTGAIIGREVVIQELDRQGVFGKEVFNKSVICDTKAIDNVNDDYHIISEDIQCVSKNHDESSNYVVLPMEIDKEETCELFITNNDNEVESYNPSQFQNNDEYTPSDCNITNTTTISRQLNTETMDMECNKSSIESKSDSSLDREYNISMATEIGMQDDRSTELADMEMFLQLNEGISANSGMFIGKDVNYDTALQNAIMTTNKSLKPEKGNRLKDDINLHDGCNMEINEKIQEATCIELDISSHSEVSDESDTNMVDDDTKSTISMNPQYRSYENQPKPLYNRYSKEYPNTSTELETNQQHKNEPSIISDNPIERRSAEVARGVDYRERPPKRDPLTNYRQPWHIRTVATTSRGEYSKTSNPPRDTPIKKRVSFEKDLLTRTRDNHIRIPRMSRSEPIGRQQRHGETREFVTSTQRTSEIAMATAKSDMVMRHQRVLKSYRERGILGAGGENAGDDTRDPVRDRDGKTNQSMQRTSEIDMASSKSDVIMRHQRVLENYHERGILGAGGENAGDDTKDPVRDRDGKTNQLCSSSNMENVHNNGNIDEKKNH